MSGILPLTTTFTPPTSCLTDLMRATSVDQLGPSSNVAECFPSGFKFDGNFYYSPGLCPDSYTTATLSTNQLDSLVQTVAYCCPTGFSWTNSGMVLTTCQSLYDTAETSSRTLAIYSGTSFASAWHTDGPGYAIASVVQVRYQATDQSILTPQSHVATATITSTVTAQAAAEGLSTGAKAGIGIGVPIIVLLLIAIGVGITLLRQRRRQYVAASQDGRILSTEMKPIGEIDGAPVAELD